MPPRKTHLNQQYLFRSLEKTKRTIESILTSINDIIVHATPEGKIQYINQVGLDFIQKKPTEVLHTPIKDYFSIIHENQNVELDQDIQHVATELQTIEYTQNTYLENQGHRGRP